MLFALGKLRNMGLRLCLLWACSLYLLEASCGRQQEVFKFLVAMSKGQTLHKVTALFHTVAVVNAEKPFLED